MDSRHRRLKLDGYLKALEEDKRAAKGPEHKRLLQEEIDRVKSLMTPPEQRNLPPNLKN